MTTNVIDINIHGSAFPSTYIGSGDTLGNPIAVVGGVDRVSGYFTGKGNAVSIPVGFQPTHVKVVDDTNSLVWEWHRGMTATHTIKMTLGTVAAVVDTTTAISVTVDNTGNGTVLLSAGLSANAANLVYEIEA